MEIGGCIRILRQKMNISQGKLAKLVGVSSTTINKWEAGKRLPTASRIQALKTIFSAHFQQAQLEPLLNYQRLISSEPEPLQVEVRYTQSEFKAEQSINKFSRSFLKYANDLFQNEAVQADFAKWQAKRAAKEAQAYGQN